MSTVLHFRHALEKSQALGDHSITFTLKFSGSLPFSQLQAKIPLDILIAIPEDIAPHVTTAVCTNTCPSITLPRLERVPSNIPSPSIDTHSRSESAQHRHFPFISSSFDYKRREAWATLAQEIQNWLVSSGIPQDAEYWLSGRDAFFMAFTAAYPTFPGPGDWPNWDPRIPLGGDFIDSHIILSDDDDDDDDDDDVSETSDDAESETYESHESGDVSNAVSAFTGIRDEDSEESLQRVWREFSKFVHSHFPGSIQNM